MGKVFGIDMGSSYTRMYAKGTGVVLREPSVVTVDERIGRIRATGEPAKRMLGKTPIGITACQPLQNGMIVDFDVATGMLEKFYHDKGGRSLLLGRPHIYLAVPNGATGTERRSFYEVAAKAGAKSVDLVPEAVAAAIGAGIKIEEPRGKMIVNIGGGMTEVTVISFGGVVESNPYRVGGINMDRAIRSYLRRQYGITIGDVTAETVKKTVGCVALPEEEKTMEVHGSSEGHPITITVSSHELRDPLSVQANAIIEGIRATFEKTSPELCSDIRDSGITLVGGTAQLVGLDRLIEQRIGVRAVVAKNPMDCVINGIGKIIENGDKFHIVEKMDR